MSQSTLVSQVLEFPQGGTRVSQVLKFPGGTRVSQVLEFPLVLEFVRVLELLQLLGTTGLSGNLFIQMCISENMSP